MQVVERFVQVNPFDAVISNIPLTNKQTHTQTHKLDYLRSRLDADPFDPKDTTRVHFSELSARAQGHIFFLLEVLATGIGANF